MAVGRGQQGAGLGSAFCHGGAGDARDHPTVVSTWRHDHPGDGGQAARGWANTSAPRFASVVRCRSSHPRAYRHESAGALHDRRSAVSARGRPGLRDQQPENPQRHEQGRHRPHQFHLRLPAAVGQTGPRRGGSRGSRQSSTKAPDPALHVEQAGVPRPKNPATSERPPRQGGGPAGGPVRTACIGCGSAR